MSVLVPLVAFADAAASSSSGSSSGTALVVAVLSAGGVGAIMAAVVSGLFSKRKLGAEATEIITKAAAGVVTDLRAEIDRQKVERKEDQADHEAIIARMAAAHARQNEEVRRVLQLHVAWDAIAIAKLAELGVELPPTPPVSVAQRFVDDAGYPL